MYRRLLTSSTNTSTYGQEERGKANFTNPLQKAGKKVNDQVNDKALFVHNSPGIRTI